MPLNVLVANLLRGLLMGGADVIPGVSGGTVALILGIYERLIQSIRAAASGLALIVRADTPAARRRFGEVEWTLVLPLAAGIGSAIALGSLVIPPLLEHNREPVFAFFFGLILGSVAVPLRRIERLARIELALIGVFALAAFALVGLPPREIANPSLLFVFAAAAVAICAMILPGVSGAFLLLVFGIYEATLTAVKSLDVAYVLTFMAGAAIGLGAFSRLLAYLLRYRHSATMAALTGLMVGSVRALWPWQTEERVLQPPPGLPDLVAMGALALVGFLAVSLLIRFGSTRARPLPA
jgi:putative membrane protein